MLYSSYRWALNSLEDHRKLALRVRAWLSWTLVRLTAFIYLPVIASMPQSSNVIVGSLLAFELACKALHGVSVLELSGCASVNPESFTN